jgi:hypothetical protein
VTATPVGLPICRAEPGEAEVPGPWVAVEFAVAEAVVEGELVASVGEDVLDDADVAALASELAVTGAAVLSPPHPVTTVASSAAKRNARDVKRMVPV